MTAANSAAQAPRPGPGMRYPFPHAPVEAALEPVADGVYWLRMPLPFALNHINLWLLDDGVGWTLVDTGLANDAVKAIWHRILRDRLDRPIHRILVTHFHPDHLGLAGWLQERCDAPLLASASEWLFGSLLYYDAEGRASHRMLAFYGSHGLGDDWLRQLDQGNRYRRLVSPPPTYYQRLRHDDRLQIGAHTWRVMVGRGHSPEHLCLHSPEAGVLISGDQVLPRITPNISVYASEPDANPLQDYLDSLQQFRNLPDDTLVLPAHGFPFHGLLARLDYIEEHHGDHFDELLAGLVQPRQAADLIPVLFDRELDAHQMMFAMGETLAHLACLVGRQQVRRERDAQGRYHFVRT